jgi:hypothetical protein
MTLAKIHKIAYAASDAGTARIRPDDGEDKSDDRREEHLSAKILARSEGFEPPTF